MYGAVGKEQYNDNGRVNLETLQQKKRYCEKSDPGVDAEPLYSLLAEFVSHRSQHHGNDRRNAGKHACHDFGAAKERHRGQQRDHRNTGRKDMRENGNYGAKHPFSR